MMIPLRVVSCSSIRFTTMRSERGLIFIMFVENLQFEFIYSRVFARWKTGNVEAHKL